MPRAGARGTRVAMRRWPLLCGLVTVAAGAHVFTASLDVLTPSAARFTDFGAHPRGRIRVDATLSGRVVSSRAAAPQVYILMCTAAGTTALTESSIPRGGDLATASRLLCDAMAAAVDAGNATTVKGQTPTFGLPCAVTGATSPSVWHGDSFTTSLRLSADIVTEDMYSLFVHTCARQWSSADAVASTPPSGSLGVAVLTNDTSALGWDSVRLELGWTMVNPGPAYLSSTELAYVPISTVLVMLYASAICLWITSLRRYTVRTGDDSPWQTRMTPPLLLKVAAMLAWLILWVSRNSGVEAWITSRYMYPIVAVLSAADLGAVWYLIFIISSGWGTIIKDVQPRLRSRVVALLSAYAAAWLLFVFFGPDLTTTRPPLHTDSDSFLGTGAVLEAAAAKEPSPYARWLPGVNREASACGFRVDSSLMPATAAGALAVATLIILIFISAIVAYGSCLLLGETEQRAAGQLDVLRNHGFDARNTALYLKYEALRGFRPVWWGYVVTLAAMALLSMNSVLVFTVPWLPWLLSEIATLVLFGYVYHTFRAQVCWNIPDEATSSSHVVAALAHGMDPRLINQRFAVPAVSPSRLSEQLNARHNPALARARGRNGSIDIEVAVQLVTWDPSDEFSVYFVSAPEPHRAPACAPVAVIINPDRRAVIGEAEDYVALTVSSAKSRNSPATHIGNPFALLRGSLTPRAPPSPARSPRVLAAGIAVSGALQGCVSGGESIPRDQQPAEPHRPRSWAGSATFVVTQAARPVADSAHHEFVGIRDVTISVDAEDTSGVRRASV